MDKLKHLPDKPGVYLMKDKQGNVIYVGKALSLRNRVKSYFQQTVRQAPKVQALAAKIHDIDYLVTDSEVEALILECNLIKQYRPRYNVSLKDDKTYPYLKVTLAEDFPRVVITRRQIKDGSKYFGPYTQAGAVHETLKLLRSIFPLRTCKQEKLNYRQRPCLNAHIGRCLAPCSGNLPREQYQEMIREIILFLEGRQGELAKNLAVRMEQAANLMNFEQAARLRDQLQAIGRIMEKQKVISARLEDQDVVALAREKERCCVLVFYIRGGKLLGKNSFFLKETAGITDSEVLAAFLKQYYNRQDFIPPVILLETGPGEHALLEIWLTGKRGSNVVLKVPRQGGKAKLVAMAKQNAELAMLEKNELLREQQAAALNNSTGAWATLADLAGYLGLSTPPRRMECYDISNIQGSQAVGSMVAFLDGLPSSQDYRRFTIKSVTGPNDFAAMEEIVRRRFAQGRAELELMAAGELSLEEAKFLPLPDLVIVDGGKGQLSSARKAMEGLEFAHIPAFGLAKREEALFCVGTGEPVYLPEQSAALYLLQRIRDEAHRFAITFHRQVRGKTSLVSSLDNIKGVGKERRTRLLKHFGSVAKIKLATVADLTAVPGISRRLAEDIYRYYQESPSG